VDFLFFLPLEFDWQVPLLLPLVFAEIEKIHNLSIKIVILIVEKLLLSYIPIT